MKLTLSIHIAQEITHHSFFLLALGQEQQLLGCSGNQPWNIPLRQAGKQELGQVGLVGLVASRLLLELLVLLLQDG
jgi:hypothetical protein